MKSSTFVAIAASLLPAFTDALNILEARADPSVLDYDLHRRDASTLNASLANDYVRLHTKTDVFLRVY